jgi:hypothetical protein
MLYTCGTPFIHHFRMIHSFVKLGWVAYLSCQMFIIFMVRNSHFCTCNVYYSLISPCHTINHQNYSYYQEVTFSVDQSSLLPPPIYSFHSQVTNILLWTSMVLIPQRKFYVIIFVIIIVRNLLTWSHILSFADCDKSSCWVVTFP